MDILFAFTVTRTILLALIKLIFSARQLPANNTTRSTVPPAVATT